MKQRHEFYLDEDVSEQLARLASKPGASKTAVMSAALRAYLDRRAGNELDDRFRVRLDRLAREVGRVARDQQIVAESVALLVHAYIRNTPPGDTADREAILRTKERFDRFLEMVSRNISNGHSFIDDVVALTRAPETKQ